MKWIKYEYYAISTCGTYKVSKGLVRDEWRYLCHIRKGKNYELYGDGYRLSLEEWDKELERAA